jgi:hypothetical protein
MDLSSISTKKKANQGAFLHLKDPRDPKGETYLFDGETEVGLFMMGKDSDLFQSTRNKNFNEAILGAAGKKKKKDETLEEIRARANDMLSSMTTGWQGLSLEGDSEFTRDKILKVYNDAGWDWLRKQANEFIDVDANFI